MANFVPGHLLFLPLACCGEPSFVLAPSAYLVFPVVAASARDPGQGIRASEGMSKVSSLASLGLAGDHRNALINMGCIESRAAVKARAPPALHHKTSSPLDSWSPRFFSWRVHDGDHAHGAAGFVADPVQCAGCRITSSTRISPRGCLTFLARSNCRPSLPPSSVSVYLVSPSCFRLQR
jgi:hypothetical protein